MPTPTERQLPKTTTFSVANAAVPAHLMDRLEGQEAMAGGAAIKPLIVGDDMLLIEIRQKKGLRVPKHQHDDHESVIYLVSGKMWLWIDGREFTAGPGDSWIHPRGVPHYSEALEDCLTIEVKSPPRKTW